MTTLPTIPASIVRACEVRMVLEPGPRWHRMEKAIEPILRKAQDMGASDERLWIIRTALRIALEA